jgi:hypothetical protein
MSATLCTKMNDGTFSGSRVQSEKRAKSQVAGMRDW